ncbi:hypothetical protein EJB05_14154, partial [Eragrostis curvula]
SALASSNIQIHIGYLSTVSAIRSRGRGTTYASILMAETISSAVIQETVNRFLSGMVQKYEEEYESDANKKLERLEMAHIRLEAALETSYKWQITDASMLRWRKKLKRAAQECGDTLHKCKQRVLEDENIEQEVRNSSLPNRISHATKSFVLSIFSGNNNELSSSTVQRFEWFADGASEFLRFVELGGTPRRQILYQSFVNNLLAGKELHHEIVWGNGYPLFQLCLLPFSTSDRGIETSLILIKKDSNGPEVSTYFHIALQVSETTDIIGIAVKCLHLFAPHFKYATDDIKKVLTQLHTQNISWVPSVCSRKKECHNVYSFASQCYRPNPLCCKQHDQHELRHISNSDIVGSSDVSLEPVIEVDFQTFLYDDVISLQDAPYLRTGIIFAPHRSLNGILPANKSSSIVAVVGKEQCCLHTDVTFQQLKEIMLPKAIDYFYQNANATVYQMIWKSEHGSAVIFYEKADMSTVRISMETQRSFVRARKRKVSQRKDLEHNRTRMIPDLLQLCGAHMLVRLQSIFINWMQKEKERQFEARHLGRPEIPCYVWMIRENREEYI